MGGVKAGGDHIVRWQENQLPLVSWNGNLHNHVSCKYKVIQACKYFTDWI